MCDEFELRNRWLKNVMLQSLPGRVYSSGRFLFLARRLNKIDNSTCQQVLLNSNA